MLATFINSEVNGNDSDEIQIEALTGTLTLINTIVGPGGTNLSGGITEIVLP